MYFLAAACAFAFFGTNISGKAIAQATAPDDASDFDLNRASSLRVDACVGKSNLLCVLYLFLCFCCLQMSKVLPSPASSWQSKADDDDDGTKSKWHRKSET